MKIITITGYKGEGESTAVLPCLPEHGTNRSWWMAILQRSIGQSGSFPFETVDQRQAMKATSRKGLEYLSSTPARPDSDDMKELAEGLADPPYQADVISLEPMLQTVSDLALQSSGS